MIIFGIDAGLTAPGFSIVESDLKSPGTVLHAECFKPVLSDNEKQLKIKKKLPKTTEDVSRITSISKKIIELFEIFKPETFVVELPTGGARSAAAIKGMAISTAMTTATITAILTYNKDTKINFVTITPMQNKKGSTGLKTWNNHDDKSKDKWEILRAVQQIWPNFVDWPKLKRKNVLNDAECWAIADALSCVATFLRANYPDSITYRSSDICG